RSGEPSAWGPSVPNSDVRYSDAAIHQQMLGGDEACAIRSQVADCLGDIRHMTETAKRRRIDALLVALGIAVSHRAFRRYGRRADRIDADVLCTKLRSSRTGDAEDA